MQLDINLLPFSESVLAGQSLHDHAADASEYVPPAHCVQGSDPFAALNLPASHALQLPPSGPEYPSIHLQSVSAELDQGDDVCCGQGKHRLRLLEAYVFLPHALQDNSDISPGVLEYVPALHCEHGADPRTPLYVPAIHAVHSMPFGPV